MSIIILSGLRQPQEHVLAPATRTFTTKLQLRMVKTRTQVRTFVTKTRRGAHGN